SKKWTNDRPGDRKGDPEKKEALFDDLTVRRGVEGGSVVLVIHDTGPVLDLSRLEEDLSPIHVLEGDRAHLNLAIARRIIDEHNGHFGCAAVPSGGLRLQISLPSDRRALARHRVQ
ncbi:MAG: hypothetical protein JSV00_04490, partial [bacterium]